MNEMETRKQLGRLVSDYQDGRLNRREFMKRAVAAGVTASAAGSMLVSGSAAQAAGHAQKGGTLREGYDLDFSKHDPITTNWYDPAFFAIYEAILTNDPDGGDSPQLATGFSMSDDGMQYRFDIDPNRTFHSGKPANAEAVADYLKTFKSLAFIATLAAAVDNYTSEGDQLVINMKNPWVGTLGPHKTGYFRISCTDTWREAGGESIQSYAGLKYRPMDSSY
jgi:peptide/nickel transport system substrate-binding protein